METFTDMADYSSDIPEWWGPSDFHEPASHDQVEQPYADGTWVDQWDHWVDEYDWGMESWAHSDHDGTAIEDDEWEKLKHARTLELGETSDGELDGAIVPCPQDPKDIEAGVSGPAELGGLDGDFSAELQQALLDPDEFKGLGGDFSAELQQALLDPDEFKGLDGDFSAELQQALLDANEFKGSDDDFSAELEALVDAASGGELTPKDPHIQQLTVLE